MRYPGVSRHAIERAYLFSSLKIESDSKTPRPAPVKPSA
jgi:hypothetical protein